MFPFAAAVMVLSAAFLLPAVAPVVAPRPTWVRALVSGGYASTIGVVLGMAFLAGTDAIVLGCQRGGQRAGELGRPAHCARLGAVVALRGRVGLLLAARRDDWDGTCVAGWPLTPLSGRERRLARPFSSRCTSTPHRPWPLPPRRLWDPNDYENAHRIRRMCAEHPTGTFRPCHAAAFVTFGTSTALGRRIRIIGDPPCDYITTR